MQQINLPCYCQMKDGNGEYLLFLHPVSSGSMTDDGVFSFLQEKISQPFLYLTVGIADWNKELSPWDAPAVFKNEDFGHGAADILYYIEELVLRYKVQYPICKVILGGYSLAGLFALWSGHESEHFDAIAAASPSVWFPNFLTYAKEHPFLSGYAALSVGDKEERTRHPVLSQVGNALREYESILSKQGVPCSFIYHRGNHFKDAALRTAHAFYAAATREALAPIE